MFQKYFGLICSRKINVVLLLLNGEVDYCPSWYSNMLTFYSSMLYDGKNERKLSWLDRYEIFAPFKRHVLADLEAWYLWNIEEGLVADEFLDDINIAPVVVTMLWIMFENGEYRYLLSKYLVIDHFDNANTFPVFFKYMCSPVVYRTQKVPLYVIFLGLKLGNTCPDLRELN